MDRPDLVGLTGGTPLDVTAVVDLALSAGTSAVWRLDFADDSLSWMPGLDMVLAMPGADDDLLQDRLATLIAPMAEAARTAQTWQEFDLEQRCDPADGEPRWIRLRGRVYQTEGASGLLGVATDVTDRRGAEQALTDLADRYRLLVELSPDGICVHQGGIVTYVNAAAVRLIGAGSGEEMVGRPLTDFVHPDSVPGMAKRIAHLTDPGAASEPSEAMLVRTDGGTVAVQAVSVRTMWHGQPALQVIVRDMSAQRAAESSLRYQAALVHHVSDAIIGVDDTGVVTSWNPAAESIYGHAAEAALGRHVSEMIGAPLDVKEMIRSGGVARTTHHRADGTELAVRVSAAQMGDPGGGHVLLCADETARRRAELYYTTVVASLEEGVIVIGDTGRIEAANPAAERILGVPVNELLALPTERFELNDEFGRALPTEQLPSEVTRRTGRPQNGRVVSFKRPTGETVWLSVGCRPLDGTDPPYAVVASFSDITERRAIADRLMYEATHDPLTGLANRTMVAQRLGHALSRAGRPIGVLFIDLDKFKVINDSLGHAVGDEVLQVVGQRLEHGVRRSDLVGRLGGDEFVVMTSGKTAPDALASLSRHLHMALTEPISVRGRQLYIDASIGIVVAEPGDSRAPEDLLRDADVAMYQAKTAGGGRYEFFDVALREQIQRRMSLAADLRAAIGGDQLWVAFQPVVDVRTGRNVSVEALLRWRHPSRGALSPGLFIPLSEETGMINLIGRHALNLGVTEVASRRRRGIDVELAVNVSPRQLDEPELVGAVREVLEATGLSPAALCLEITESTIMRDPAVATKRLSALRDLGVRLAIDDFGTGYSSLAQLQRLPLDFLKVDQSFVAELGRSADAEPIVRSIVGLAHAVGLTVIAEGVETEYQLETLRRLGVDQVQGYLLGRPVAPEELFADQPTERWVPLPATASS